MDGRWTGGVWELGGRVCKKFVGRGYNVWECGIGMEGKSWVVD